MKSEKAFKEKARRSELNEALLELSKCILLLEYSPQPESLQDMPRIPLIKLGTCSETCANYDALRESVVKATACLNDLYHRRIENQYPFGPPPANFLAPGPMRDFSVSYGYDFEQYVSNWDLIFIFFFPT